MAALIGTGKCSGVPLQAIQYLHCFKGICSTQFICLMITPESLQ